VTKCENEQIEKIYLHYFAFSEIIFGIKKLPEGGGWTLPNRTKQAGVQMRYSFKIFKKIWPFRGFLKNNAMSLLFFLFLKQFERTTPFKWNGFVSPRIPRHGLNGKFPKRAVTKDSSQHSRPNWVVIGISFAFVGNSVAFWVSQTQKHDEQYLNCHLL